MKLLNQEQINKATLISAGRNAAADADNQNYQNKRQKFLDWLTTMNPNPIEFNTLLAKYGNLKKKEFNIFITQAPVMTCEMYSGDVQSNLVIYQYFNSNHNTRTKVQAETRWETDKLSLNKAIALCCEICLSLIRSNIHFCVFYAKGQRSPHVIIYDWEELEELTPFQRVKAQVAFWRKHVPFGCFQFTDTGVFDDEHLVPLEFASHWKHGTIFDLLFEWRLKCKD